MQLHHHPSCLTKNLWGSSPGSRWQSLATLLLLSGTAAGQGDHRLHACIVQVKLLSIAQLTAVCHSSLSISCSRSWIQSNLGLKCRGNYIRCKGALALEIMVHLPYCQRAGCF